MGSEWTVIPLGECGQWYSGGTPDTGTAEYWNGNIPWISASSLHDFYIRDSERRVTQLGIENGTRLMPAQTIIFVVRGMSLKTEFRVGIAQRPVAFGQDCKAIIVRAGIDPTFLAYSLRARAPEILGIADEASHGTGRLQTEALQQLEIDLPPLPEQRAIAAVLGALDDKIELNRRMNGTLEAMARALFKSWFVDFDPVRAKMDHRNAGTVGAGLVPAPDNDPTPEEGNHKGLPQPPDIAAPAAPAQDEEGNHKGLPQPPDIAALFPDEMEVGEDGVERPLGWGVGMIGDIAENVRRGVQPENIAPGTPYIALEHMPRRSISLSDWGIADGLESNKSEFKHGEILFGKLRPYFHKVGVAPVDGVCSTDILVIRPRDPSWFGVTLGHISSRELIDYTTALSTGTKMPRTNWHDIARYEITLPPVELAAKYSDLMLQFVQRIQSSIEESRTLSALRDALLPKLMSGEVRVAAAEREAADAL